jgi:outer membrane protein assembly factor BamD
MFRKFRALAFSGCLVATVGCVTEKQAESPLHYTENAKRAYDAALVAFFDHDWEYATQLFNDVKRKYGYSRYARLAELRLADINYRQDKYAEAVGMYKSFVADYPNDPETPYARYKIAKAEFTDSGASILLPPLEERDLSNVREAHVALRALIGDYPDSEHGAELRYMLEVVTGLLVRHELYVARFYLGRDNFDAAVARCQYAITNYQDSGMEPEALVLLGETYLKMKEREKARSTFRLVLDKYPESPFTVPAKNFLARLGAGPSAPLRPSGAAESWPPRRIRSLPSRPRCSSSTTKKTSD